MRRGLSAEEACVCAFNFTPVPVEGFVIGLPANGVLTEVFNSDEPAFGGKGGFPKQSIAVINEGFGGYPYSAAIGLPPLSAIYFRFIEKIERGEDV